MTSPKPAGTETGPLPERVGKYQIVRRIGAGGMGQVYLGKDPDSGESFAIKVLSATLAQEGGFVDRFQREIDAMRKLSHPNIVQFHDGGLDGERYYFAMQYIDGETLLAHIKRVRRVPWKVAFQIGSQICKALKAAHDHGIIHRDLKPSNLLIDNENRVFLTDFGVAQIFELQRITVTGGIIGTAEFMSPEQASGKRATRHSDLYSLGVVLYTLITGRTPFQGQSAVDVMHKHRFGLFDRPRSILPDLPSRVDDTICKLLEKDPQKRFPDAYVLGKHLDSVIAVETMIETDETRISGERPRADGQTAILLTDVPSVRDSSEVSEQVDEYGRDDGDVPSNHNATLMRDFIKSEIRAHEKSHPLIAWLQSTPVLIVLLVLVISFVYWAWPRRLTNEEMFNRGVALMDQGKGLNYLQARREYFDPLVQRDSSAWQEQVAPYLAEIELYEQERQIAKQNRKERKLKPEVESFDPNDRSGNRPQQPSDQSSGRAPDEVGEPTRLLDEARRLAQVGMTLQAKTLLDHLLVLLPDDDAMLELRRQIAMEREMIDQLETTTATEEFIRTSIDRTNNLKQAGQSQAADRIIEALRGIYGNHPLLPATD